MGHRITAVTPGSAAARYGVKQGCDLISINGESIKDVLDYQYLTADKELYLICEADGVRQAFTICKDECEPLGLEFESSLMSPVFRCKNHCLFCFIDQMPKGGRETLHFKDDDWRLSLIMGNYVTLTNVGDEEFERIISRRVSPLYVSVHATDPEVRVKMMGNPTAGRLMERLERLKKSGLKAHCQIVVCPGINDGAVLEKSIGDLARLYPAVQSVAVVPVGLTRFREGLYPLRCFTSEEARSLINLIERRQAALRTRLGTSFVFAADEMYLKAGLSLPDYEHYEGFSQLENGVGLLRRFEEGFLYALKGKRPFKAKRRFIGATGVAAHSFMQKLFNKLVPYGIELELKPIKNRYFGETVTVSGLICGQDIAEQIRGSLDGRGLLLPRCMLRERDSVFLDGYTLERLSDELGVNINALCAHDGEEFINELYSISRRR